MDISLYFKIYSKGHEICNQLNLSSVALLDFNSLSRNIANKLRRCLPSEILIITDTRTDNTNWPVKPFIEFEGKTHPLDKCHSRLLNAEFPLITLNKNTRS